MMSSLFLGSKFLYSLKCGMGSVISERPVLVGPRLAIRITGRIPCGGRLIGCERVGGMKMKWVNQSENNVGRLSQSEVAVEKPHRRPNTRWLTALAGELW